MDLIKFIPETLAILIAVLVFMGAMIKQAAFIKDAYIPFILTVIGVTFAVFVQGFNVTSVLQGIVCTAIAVYGNNVVKQASELLNKDKVLEILDKDKDKV